MGRGVTLFEEASSSYPLLENPAYDIQESWLLKLGSYSYDLGVKIYNVC